MFVFEVEVVFEVGVAFAIGVGLAFAIELELAALGCGSFTATGTAGSRGFGSC